LRNVAALIINECELRSSLIATYIRRWAARSNSLLVADGFTSSRANRRPYQPALCRCSAVLCESRLWDIIL